MSKGANPRSEVNNWAVLDWQDDTAYAGLQWNLLEWQWQFLRRLPDYGDYFEECAVAKHLSALKEYEEVKRLVVEGRIIDHSGTKMVELKDGSWRLADYNLLPMHPSDPCYYVAAPDPRKYNTPVLINPRNDAPETHVLHMAFYDRVKSGIKIHASLHGSFRSIPGETMLVEIDLSRPIRPQLNSIEATALAFTSPKKRIDLKRRAKARRLDLWRLYLRVLDARNAGATWSEIATLLPPSRASRTPQDAWDVHQQATRLCFGA